MSFAALDHHFRFAGDERLVSTAAELCQSLPLVPDAATDAIYHLRQTTDLDNALAFINLAATQQTPGLVLLHAAGLRAPDGRGIALVGASGAGKSTLCAMMIRRSGWSYLSDETVAVDPRTLLIRPYPKALTLKSGSQAMFPSLNRSPAQVWHVPPHELRKNCLTSQVTRLSTILLPRRDLDGVGVTSLTCGEVVLKMAANSSYLLKLDQPLAALATIAREVEGYELAYSDVMDAVMYLEGRW